MMIPKFSRFTIFLVKVLLWVVLAIIAFMIWGYYQSLVGWEGQTYLLCAVYRKKGNE